MKFLLRIKFRERKKWWREKERMSYLFILVCGDSNELCLWERKCDDFLLIITTFDSNHMDSRFILVKGVENNLLNDEWFVTIKDHSESGGKRVRERERDKKSFITWPLLGLGLLVSFTLENETGSFIQWAPKLGDSGWRYTQWGWGGSALPPGTQSPFMYFHRLLPTWTNSRANEYIALGSSPSVVTLTTGNIRLKNMVEWNVVRMNEREERVRNGREKKEWETEERRKSEKRKREERVRNRRDRELFYLPTTFGDNHFIHNRIELSPKIFILKAQIDTIILGVWRRHIALDDWVMIETTFYDS